MTKLLSFLLLFFPLQPIFAQYTASITIPWKGDKSTGSLYEQTLYFPAFPFQYTSDGSVCFVYKQQQKGISNSYWKAEISSMETLPASDFDKDYITKHNIAVGEQLSFTMTPTRSRMDEYFSFELLPYINSGGQLKRVSKVSFSIHNAGNIPPKSKSFAASSVLSTGSWYRIEIPSSGVYKIDKAFLENLGISTTGLATNSINIYGNGQGMLPISNSTPRPDDLLKNAIQVNDGGDNTFDQNDFILFYANGPDALSYSSGYGFTITKNVYCDASVYFIHIDPTDPPSRITPAPLSPNPVTNTITTSNNVSAHEEDLSNFVKSGQRWYGEHMDNTLDYSIPFTLNGVLASSPTQVSYSFANSGSGVGSSFKFYVNGTMLQSSNCSNASGDDAAIRGSNSFVMNTSNPSANVTFELSRSNASVQGWLDKIEINYEGLLIYPGNQINFRNSSSVGVGNVSEFNVSNISSLHQIWEVSHPSQAQQVNFSLSGNTGSYRMATDSLLEFVVFQLSDAKTPQAIGKIDNQNLHALPLADMLIVSNPEYIDQANRLANLHKAQGLRVNVVTNAQVFNEFSSGMQDPVAIRWFTKMFYDRASTASDKPKYLCLFGDGSYDPKNRISGNNNKIVTYQSVTSENFVASFVSDDFFGMLDNTEAFNNGNLVDVGVGRITASSAQQAIDLVNKIEHYMKNGSALFPDQGGVEVDANGYSSTFGDWRLWVTQIADDEESGQFVYDQESYYKYYDTTYPVLNSDKIYLDAYKQISTTGGQRFPDVPDAINNRIERGNLIMSYVGHGGETGLALERILTIPQILDWKNINRLPLFVSATCEFTRYDDPSRVSAGEEMYLSNKGGAISLMTTTRPVSIWGNSLIGKNLIRHLFQRDANGAPLAMGEILRRTKVDSDTATGNDARIFTLLGDPALPLCLPPLNIVIDSVNGISPNVAKDTLRSLSKITIKAHVEDTLGNIITGFNGVAYPSVFDKPKTYKTLGQDPTSPIINFQMQKNFLYRGKSTVKDGYFSFTFIVPKDIDYNYGTGKISTYANSTSTDAMGVDKRVVIGGIDPNGIADNTGPEVRLFMNDESFVNEGITNDHPIFLAKLFDDNGINTVGNGIGHDITAILDENSNNPIILNQFYEADLDTYQRGKISYPLYDLQPGKHSISLKVWDINNNSSDARIDFTVVRNDLVTISHVLNYPNPFTTHTEFFFEHNQIDVSLKVQIQIMTITGKLVKTINQYVNTIGFRSEGIEWDGRDDFGDQLAKGVYIYKLTVTAPDGSSANKIEKLVLLK